MDAKPGQQPIVRGSPESIKNEQGKVIVVTSVSTPMEYFVAGHKLMEAQRAAQRQKKP